MELDSFSVSGVQSGKAIYRGKHRDQEMPKGCGFIPLGDRDRDIYGYGFDVVEERGNNDPNARLK